MRRSHRQGCSSRRLRQLLNSVHAAGASTPDDLAAATLARAAIAVWLQPRRRGLPLALEFNDVSRARLKRIVGFSCKRKNRLGSWRC